MSSSPIDAAQAAWLLGPVSILVATASVGRRPSLGLGLGLDLSADRRHVRVFVLDAVCRSVLEDIRAGSGIAVVFTHSASTRALQVKATRATIAPLTPADPPRLDAHADALAREWHQNGQTESFARAYLVRAPGTVVTIGLEPEVVFEQSPGPRAGIALSSVR